MDFILTLSCPDRPGLVLAVSEWLVSFDGNILESDQFRDGPSNTFYMRLRFEAALTKQALVSSFERVAQENQMT